MVKHNPIYCQKGSGQCELLQGLITDAVLYPPNAYRRTLHGYSQPETKSTFHKRAGTTDPRMARSNGSHQLRTHQKTSIAGGVILRLFYFNNN